MVNPSCPNCTFVNSANETVCKQCNSSLSVTSETKPSITKIIKNYDYTILLILFPIGFFVLFVVVDVFGISVTRRGISVTSSDLPISLLLAVGTAILAIPVLAWHVTFVRGVFAKGQEVIGRITSVSLNQINNGGINYSYVVNDQEYQNIVGIIGFLVGKETVNSFHVGNEVVLIVDRSNPKRAFIKDLYL